MKRALKTVTESQVAETPDTRRGKQSDPTPPKDLIGCDISNFCEYGYKNSQKLPQYEADFTRPANKKDNPGKKKRSHEKTLLEDLASIVLRQDISRNSDLSIPWTTAKKLKKYAEEYYYFPEDEDPEDEDS